MPSTLHSVQPKSGLPPYPHTAHTLRSPPPLRILPEKPRSHAMINHVQLAPPDVQRRARHRGHHLGYGRGRCHATNSDIVLPLPPTSHPSRRALVGVLRRLAVQWGHMRGRTPLRHMYPRSVFGLFMLSIFKFSHLYSTPNNGVLINAGITWM